MPAAWLTNAVVVRFICITAMLLSLSASRRCFRLWKSVIDGEEMSCGMSEGLCTKPFVVMLGIVTLTVPQVDYEEFSKAIQDAVSMELDLPGITGGLLSLPGKFGR